MLLGATFCLILMLLLFLFPTRSGVMSVLLIIVQMTFRMKNKNGSAERERESATYKGFIILENKMLVFVSEPGPIFQNAKYNWLVVWSEGTCF